MLFAKVMFKLIGRVQFLCSVTHREQTVSNTGLSQFSSAVFSFKPVYLLTNPTITCYKAAHPVPSRRAANWEILS